MNTKISSKNISYILFLSLVFVSIFLGYVVFGSVSLKEINLSDFLYLFGKFAGVIGFLFLSILIFSGDTAKFFNKILGVDKMVNFQRKFSLITLLFVLTHPIFFIVGEGALLPSLVTNISLVPLALGILSLYLFIIFITVSIFQKRVSDGSWKYLKVLTYVLFGSTIYHAYIAGTDSNHFAIRALYSVTLTIVAVGFIYKTQNKIRQIFFPKFYMEDVLQKTKGN